MPKIIILSESQKKFIENNYLTIGSLELSLEIGSSKAFILRYLKTNNLIVPKAVLKLRRVAKLKGKTTFTQHQDNFIKQNYLSIPLKTMATKINRSHCGVALRIKNLGLAIPKELAEKRKAESQFKKGSRAHNKGKKQTDFMSASAIEKTKKTRFKKGNIPHNYTNGEHLTKEGYVMASLGSGKKRLKHVIEWEKINGKLPKAHCLKCLSKEKTNCNADNWQLISKSELMLQNSRHNYPTEIIPSMVLRSKINNKLKQLQNG